MARKTIAVGEIRDWVNTTLATAGSSLFLDGMTAEQAFRLGAASVLERALHNTGNYAGFGYQMSEELSEEERAAGASGLRPGYDDTRRIYYKR